MKLTFLGSGDAFGSGGRFNTCFYVNAASTTFLIDCGASSMIAMRQQDVDPNSVETVFISHLHGDHFAGLPFLLLDAQFYSRRTKPITLVGPEGFKDRLWRTMELLFHGSTEATRKFETKIVEFETGTAININGVSVTPYTVKHSCGAPPYALRIQCDEKIIAYTGDTEWTDELISAARGADLFIAEALVFDRKIKFHMDYASLLSNLGRIEAKRVILTHLGPEMLENQSKVLLECAHDGLSVEI
jgi:ribonuclease BN (tRNA processing enzyme)